MIDKIFRIPWKKPFLRFVNFCQSSAITRDKLKLVCLPRKKRKPNCRPKTNHSGKWAALILCCVVLVTFDLLPWQRRCAHIIIGGFTRFLGAVVSSESSVVRLRSRCSRSSFVTAIHLFSIVLVFLLRRVPASDIRCYPFFLHNGNDCCIRFAVMKRIHLRACVPASYPRVPTDLHSNSMRPSIFNRSFFQARELIIIITY